MMGGRRRLRNPSSGEQKGKLRGGVKHGFGRQMRGGGIKGRDER